MASNIPPYQQNYNYNVKTSFPPNANVHVHIHNSAEGVPNGNTPPKLIFDGTSFKPVKKPNKIVALGKKALGKAKNIRMSHIMAMIMFGMVCYTRFGMATGGGTTSSASRQAQQQWYYNQGAQHVRDSIAIAELQKQNVLLQDSIKQLKKLPK